MDASGASGAAAGSGAAAAGGADWVDDTSPDSEERLKPADLEAWRRKAASARETPPVRQPPAGLRPSRRPSSPGRPSALVPPPPPMEFTPVPELVTPPPELVPAPPRMPSPAAVATPPRAATPVPAAHASPVPASAPPAAGEIPDLTDEIDPQPAPAVWKQAHPSARKWAERRQGGAPAATRRAPSLPRVVLGILIAALGAWLVLSFLPDRKPLSAAERVRVDKLAGLDSNAWRFGPAGYMAARGGAALYLTIGILVALRGLFFRRRVEAACRRCGRRVLAERSGLRLRCENGPHSAGVNASALALLIAFSALSVALGLLVAASSLG